MIKVSLSEEERIALQRLRFSQKSAVGEKAYYVLLSDAGKSVSEIAQLTLRNAHTIRLWLKRYKSNGLIGLKRQFPPGRPTKKASWIESHLEELLTKSLFKIFFCTGILMRFKHHLKGISYAQTVSKRCHQGAI